jgi:tetratricopeptide (TPR) repeat protein
MGLVQHAIGNYRDAVSLFKKAIKIVVKEFGPVHFKAGMFSANMADSLAKCQETEQANDIFSTAIHTLRTTLGPDHIELGDAIAKYAEFKHEQGALKESFAMYKAAMAIVEKSLGKSHPKWKQYQKIAEDMEPFVASSSL